MSSEQNRAEQNKDVFRRLIKEGLSKGNLDVLDECFPATFTEHQFEVKPTREGVKATVRYLQTTFAPFSLTFEDMVADGDKVCVAQTAGGSWATRPPASPMRSP